MSIPSDKSRAHLRRRHRLSHQQIDQWLGERSGNAHLAEKMRQLEKTNAFLTFTDQLREAGFDFVCFKGALLSQRIYGDPTVRICKDFDILIEPDQMTTCMGWMLDQGFELMDHNIWSEKPHQQKIIMDFMMHISFFHPQTRLALEIHWSIMHANPIKPEKRRQLIAENTEAMHFSGRSFKVLSPEMELVYLLIHGTNHRYHRLKWLMDIRDYPYHVLDEKQFYTLLKAFKADYCLDQAIQLCKVIFSTDIPLAPIARAPGILTKEALIQIEAPEPRPLTAGNFLPRFVHYVSYKWNRFPGIQGKLLALKELFIQPEDILLLNTRFPILYMLLRPYSFVRQMGRLVVR